MITRLNVASIYVLDKDEALDFYVNKLGLEKGNDVRQGDYRWLTIRVPGEQGATEVSLEHSGDLGAAPHPGTDLGRQPGGPLEFSCRLHTPSKPCPGRITSSYDPAGHSV